MYFEDNLLANILTPKVGRYDHPVKNGSLITLGRSILGDHGAGFPLCPLRARFPEKIQKIVYEPGDLYSMISNSGAQW